MGSYDLLAFLIVLAIPIAALALVTGATRWARDALRRSPGAGSIGVVCTLAAAANLLVERPCAGTVNRPLLTAFLGPEACKQSALAAIQLVLLLAVGTALAVRADQIRR